MLEREVGRLSHEYPSLVGRIHVPQLAPTQMCGRPADCGSSTFCLDPNYIKHGNLGPKLFGLPDQAPHLYFNLGSPWAPWARSTSAFFSLTWEMLLLHP